tara:strand:- start:384 stop:770 length:387 start_codon:yes stop_codon:yes gene_type:complete
MTDCKSCFEDLTKINKVYYRINNKKNWLESKYCCNCVTYLQNTAWKIFTDQVTKADCKKALKKILDVGPPINLRDKNGFPDPIDNTKLTEIDELLFYDNIIKPAKLKDSLVGQERINYISFLENFKFT